MTDAVKKTTRKSSAIFAQRYREKARNMKEIFDKNLLDLEKTNKRLKSKEKQLENTLATMKSYVQQMKHIDLNPYPEPITSMDHCVAPVDYKESTTRVLANNRVHVSAHVQFEPSLAGDYIIPNFLMDEEIVRSPVQPVARDEGSMQVINSQSRTHDFEVLHESCENFDETVINQELVELKDVDLDSLAPIGLNDKFDLDEIYNILPHLSLDRVELNNLEIMKIEEMLRNEAAQHRRPLWTNNELTMTDKINGNPTANLQLDPNKYDIPSMDSSSASPSSLDLMFEQDDIMNYMLNDLSMDVDFRPF